MLKLYRFDVSAMSDETFFRMYQSLDKARKQKIDRLQNEPDKRLSAAAGMLARHAISHHFGIDPKEISFRLGKNKKPYADGLDIHFSLSHSGNLAVCAISDKPVGIDVEKNRDVNFGVAKKCFTEKEQYYICSDKRKMQKRFFEVWTKKEAYAKRNGMGVAQFLSFDIMNDVSTYIVQNDKYIVAVSAAPEL